MRIRVRFRSAAGELQLDVAGDVTIGADPADGGGLVLRVARPGRLRLELAAGPQEARELLRALRDARRPRGPAAAALEGLAGIRTGRRPPG